MCVSGSPSREDVLGSGRSGAVEGKESQEDSRCRTYVSSLDLTSHRIGRIRSYTLHSGPIPFGDPSVTCESPGQHPRSREQKGHRGRSLHFRRPTTGGSRVGRRGPSSLRITTSTIQPTSTRSGHFRKGSKYSLRCVPSSSRVLTEEWRQWA